MIKWCVRIPYEVLDTYTAFVGVCMYVLIYQHNHEKIIFYSFSSLWVASVWDYFHQYLNKPIISQQFSSWVGCLREKWNKYVEWLLSTPSSSSSSPRTHFQIRKDDKLLVTFGFYFQFHLVGVDSSLFSFIQYSPPHEVKPSYFNIHSCHDSTSHSIMCWIWNLAFSLWLLLEWKTICIKFYDSVVHGGHQLLW